MGVETPDRLSRWRIPLWLWAALALVLAAGVYLNALKNPFVYDDIVHIVQKETIRDFSNLRGMLAQDRFRPVVNLTYAVDHAIWRLDPLGYHLTNLAIHLLNVLLLFVLVRRLVFDSARSPGHSRLPATPIAFAAAALLAVHPLNTEAVGYISGRAEILGGLFFLAGFLCWRQVVVARARWGPARSFDQHRREAKQSAVDSRTSDRRPPEATVTAGEAVTSSARTPPESEDRSRWGEKTGLVAGLVLLGLGVMSKEHCAMLPFLLLAYDRLLVSPSEPDSRGGRRRLLWLHGPMCALVLLAGAARVWVLFFKEYGDLPRSVPENLAVQAGVIWRYLALLFVPLNQALVHQVRPVTMALDPVALASGGALVAVLALAWLMRRSLPLVSLGTIWFFLLLAPSSSVIPLLEPMAEHRVYLASGGFFLAAVVGAQRLWPSPGRGKSLTLAGLLLLVLALLSGATVARNRVWADPVALWREATASAPRVWAPHYALGDVLRQRGKCDEALRHYRRAMEILPEEARAHLNLGICLARLGKAEEARRVFEQVTRFEPDNLQARNNLGTLASSRGKLDEAKGHFGKVLAKDPSNLTALANLGVVAEKQKDFEGAYVFFEKVRALAPANLFALQHMVWINEGPFRNPSEALRLAQIIGQIRPELDGLDQTIRRLRLKVGPR